MEDKDIEKLIDGAPFYPYGDLGYERYFIKAGMKIVVERIEELWEMPPPWQALHISRSVWLTELKRWGIEKES